MRRLAAALPIAALLLSAATAQAAATATAKGTPPPAEDAAPHMENAGSQQQQQGQPSDAERRFRIMLLQRSMGFGGIFGPLIAPLNKPGTPSAQKSCGSYSNYAACQAYRNGDSWAADRIQQDRSTPAEKDWYGH